MKDKPIVPNHPAPGNPPQPKFGAGHLFAMGRLGAQEARAALYTGSNVAQPTEYGIWGKPTPGEIASVNAGPSQQNDANLQQTLDEEPASSPLQQSMKEADARAQARVPEQTRDRNQDRDR